MLNTPVRATGCLTEPEWEYAARGGNKGDGHRYAGSDDLSAVAWYGKNAGSKTHAVGGKLSNELGLYDMSGNVWEWCSDVYKPYACDTKNKTEGRYRVLRGGSWYSNAPYCRAAARDRNEPAHRYRFIGFRLVSVSSQ